MRVRLSAHDRREGTIPKPVDLVRAVCADTPLFGFCSVRIRSLFGQRVKLTYDSADSTLRSVFLFTRIRASEIGSEPPKLG
jgi:hypothetical protein